MSRPQPLLETPLDQYQLRLKTKELSPDPHQQAAMESLQRLYEELMEACAAPKKTWLHKVTKLGARKEGAPKGIYLHGGVGRGKSMVMDLFYSCLPGDIAKRRMHFHEFMIEVHNYMHERRQADDIFDGVDAVLPSMAERIAENARVLCFDEFHVTDVADAMILGRLFTALFDRDVIVIATSNWEPDRLYEGGLQRERFLPFIELLKNKMEIMPLDGELDYRTQTDQEEGSYFSPLGKASKRKADAAFKQMSGGEKPKKDSLEVKGRAIKVKAVAGGVARFTFAELCEQPHGAEDYLAIAEKYPVIFLENVPKLGYDRRNEAKRLMILIDALYENGTKLVITADAAPDKLYQGHDHAFEFERTISRLMEMQSAKYLNE